MSPVAVIWAPEVRDHSAGHVHGIVRNVVDWSSAGNRPSNREESRKTASQGRCRSPRGTTSRVAHSARTIRLLRPFERRADTERNSIS